MKKPEQMENECNLYIHFLTVGTITVLIIVLLILMVQTLINMLQVISMSGGI